MPKNGNGIRLTASVIIPKGRYFWFVQGKEDGHWAFPGGKLILSPYETFYHAARRESSEELGLHVDVSPEAVRIYQFRNSNNHPTVNITFQGEIEGEPKITKPQEIRDIKRFKLEEIERMNRRHELRYGRVYLAMLNDYKSGSRIPAEFIRYFR